MGSFFRDYKIDPDDPGEFVSSEEVRDVEFTGGWDDSGGQIHKAEDGRRLKWLVRVGGGYRAYAEKKNARNFLRQPL
jgi:ribosomal protein S6E (S10)